MVIETLDRPVDQTNNGGTDKNFFSLEGVKDPNNFLYPSRELEYPRLNEIHFQSLLALRRIGISGNLFRQALDSGEIFWNAMNPDDERRCRKLLEFTETPEELIVLGFQRLIMKAASYYSHINERHADQFMDRVQEGTRALIEAIPGYNPREQELDFISYGVGEVKKAISNFVHEQTIPVTIPRSMLPMVRRVKKHTLRAELVMGDALNDQELVGVVLETVTKEFVPYVIEAYRLTRDPVQSLDETVIDEMNQSQITTLKDMIKDESVEVEQEAIMLAEGSEENATEQPEPNPNDVFKRGDGITEKERRILQLRHDLIGDGIHSPTEIAEILGMKISNVSHSYANAISKLRRNPSQLWDLLRSTD